MNIKITGSGSYIPEIVQDNSKFLDRVNALIKIGYKPQGGISSGDGYTLQALYRDN